jgi:hypothetical protein
MFDTFLAQATSFASVAMALAEDAAATLSLLASIAFKWLSVVPDWTVIAGMPVLIGLLLPVLHAMRARRANGERAARVRRARRSRKARVTPRERARDTATPRRQPSPMVLALELVRQGLPVVEVCHRSRLSLDAVSLVMRAATNGSSRQDRPGAAPLAAPNAVRVRRGLASAAA